MEWDKIFAVNNAILDPVAPRYTAIKNENMAEVTVENI